MSVEKRQRRRGPLRRSSAAGGAPVRRRRARADRIGDGAATHHRRDHRARDGEREPGTPRSPPTRSPAARDEERREPGGSGPPFHQAECSTAATASRGRQRRAGGELSRSVGIASATGRRRSGEGNAPGPSRGFRAARRRRPPADRRSTRLVRHSWSAPSLADQRDGDVDIESTGCEPRASTRRCRAWSRPDRSYHTTPGTRRAGVAVDMKRALLVRARCGDPYWRRRSRDREVVDAGCETGRTPSGRARPDPLAAVPSRRTR